MHVQNATMASHGLHRLLQVILLSHNRNSHISSFPDGYLPNLFSCLIIRIALLYIPTSCSMFLLKDITQNHAWQNSYGFVRAE